MPHLKPTRLATLTLSLCCLLPACVAPESQSMPATGKAALSLPADPRVTADKRVQTNGKSQHYSLPQMIDLALANNPSTRAAWERSRQAAAAVGLVDSTYLPRVSAEILAGANRGSSAGAQDPLGILPAGQVNTGTGVGAAVVSVQWLLFDFGVRKATRQAAEDIAFAANVGFTGVHQTLVYDTTQAYYDLQSASGRESLQGRRLAAANEIEAMISARRAQQLATVTELAQATQLVAQAKFDMIRAQSETSIASTRLSTLAGLAPGRRIVTDPNATLQLPTTPPARLDAFITESLQRRPDLQAAFARARASQANANAIEAAFRPKIVASAALGRTMLSGSIDDTRIGGISAEADRSVSGIYLGVSIPLWDGNARKLRRDAAEADVAAAAADADHLRQLAEGEIIAAYETLKAALSANAAAAELVATAQTTYDAARSLADQGLANVSEVSVALRILYDAQLARLEAQHSVRSAAALLAFATGQIGAGL